MQTLSANSLLEASKHQHPSQCWCSARAKARRHRQLHRARAAAAASEGKDFTSLDEVRTELLKMFYISILKIHSEGSSVPLGYPTQMLLPLTYIVKPLHLSDPWPLPTWKLHELGSCCSPFCCSTPLDVQMPPTVQA